MIFSLFDIKAEVFGPLIEAHTPDDAKRMFITTLLNGSDSCICKYPQDFQLYQLGDYDRRNGFITVSEPNLIMTGFEAVQVAKQYHIQATKEIEGDYNVPSDESTSDT